MHIKCIHLHTQSNGKSVYVAKCIAYGWWLSCLCRLKGTLSNKPIEYIYISYPIFKANKPKKKKRTKQKQKQKY